MRVFISHSSRNNAQATALKAWLISNEPSLKDEIFLDTDSETGIVSGQRWKVALSQASKRCEVVICLLSTDWEASAHCKAEYLFAEELRKTIVTARLENLTQTSITSEWQRCDLFIANTDAETVTLGGAEPVQFSAEGLHRLLRGLRALGIGADYFPWPPPEDPTRAPYRGWAALDTHDAAVFFGRDAEIVRGLDKLRGMRATGVGSILLIQGPSGAGKSAFLRAGLLPRLQRDDRRFVPLEVVRPERAVLSGERGLGNAIHSLRSKLEFTEPVLGDINDACKNADIASLRRWLGEARVTAQSRLLESEPGQPAPTLILPLDQAEELFQTNPAVEANKFLTIIGELLKDRDGVTPALLLVATIRTDSYEPFQTAPQLADLETRAFNDLKTMPPAEFKEVITGPAKRASDAGQSLHIDPALTEQLLTDCATADALPLLALTLERLYRQYGSDGDLTLDEYARMGGLKRIVQTEVDEILGANPDQRQGQLDILHRAFVPSLATIDLVSGRPGRRMARLTDLPDDSHDLINAFVDNRLLVKKTRGGEVFVEVALGSLLRQWQDLARWLQTESQDLKFAERIQLWARDWHERGRDDQDLTLRGTRLAAAEKLAARERYFTGCGNPAHDFLKACRRREDEQAQQEQQRHEEQLRAEKEKKETAQRHAIAMEKSGKRARRWAVVAAVVAVIAVYGLVDARISSKNADHRYHEAAALRLASEAQAMLAGIRPEGDFRALQQLLAAPLISPPGDQGALLDAVIARRDLRKLVQTGGPVTSVAVSADGTHIAAASIDGKVRLLNAATALQEGPDIDTGHGAVWSIAFSGPNIVAGSTDGTVQIWDPATRAPTPVRLATSEPPVRSLAVSVDGQHIVAGSVDGTMRVFNTLPGQQNSPAVSTGHGSLQTVAINGDRIATGSGDGTVQLWQLDNPLSIVAMSADRAPVWSVAFSPTGDRIAAAGAGDAVWVWDVVGAARPPVRIPHTGGVWSVAWNAAGDRLATGGVDDTVRVWDAMHATQIGGALLGDRGDVKTVAFLGGNVVSGGDDGSIRLWNIPAQQPRPTGVQPRADVIGVAFANRLIVSVSANGTVSMWDSAGNPTGRSFLVNVHGGTNPVFKSDRSAMLATVTDHGDVQVWDAVKAQPVGPEIRIVQPGVAAIAFGADRIAGVGQRGNSIGEWDATAAPGDPTIMVGKDSVSALAISYDGRRLVAGQKGGIVQVWDATTGAPLTTTTMTADLDVNADERSISGVAFSDNGARVVSGAVGDDRVREWEVTTGKQIGGDMAGHQRDVTTVAFSSDGNYIVSGAKDGTVRVWDANTQQPVGQPLTVGAHYVTSVVFSPDDKRIVAGLDDGTVRVWPGPSAWREELCNKLTQPMNVNQWNVWVAQNIKQQPVCPWEESPSANEQR